MSDVLISIREAAMNGIERLREPQWADQFDHLKLDIREGHPGPWTHLFCPSNKFFNGRDPVDVIYTCMDYGDARYLPYDGPLPNSDEYMAAVARFESPPA